MKTSLSRPRRGYLVLGLALVLSGCASIFSGSSQVVQLRSSPSAANVKIERAAKGGVSETVWTGTTPASVNLKRKNPYLVSISHEGYESVELGLERGTNGWVWGNLLFFPLGTLVGAGIDYGTGAAYKINPDKVFVELPPRSSTASPDPTQVIPDEGVVTDAAAQSAEAPQRTQQAAPQSSNPAPSSREGFIIGFGLGPGRTSYTQGFERSDGSRLVSERETKLSIVSDFKIGYAPNDLLALYWMSKVSWMRFDDILVLNGHGGLGASYALPSLSESLFVNGGLGFASWQLPLEEGTETELGLGLVAGAEYEFSPHWIFDVDLMWGKPSKDLVTHNAFSFKFTVNYLHY